MQKLLTLCSRDYDEIIWSKYAVSLSLTNCWSLDVRLCEKVQQDLQTGTQWIRHCLKNKVVQLTIWWSGVGWGCLTEGNHLNATHSLLWYETAWQKEVQCHSQTVAWGMKWVESGWKNMQCCSHPIVHIMICTSTRKLCLCHSHSASGDNEMRLPAPEGLWSDTYMLLSSDKYWYNNILRCTITYSLSWRMTQLHCKRRCSYPLSVDHHVNLNECWQEYNSDAHYLLVSMTTDYRVGLDSATHSLEDVMRPLGRENDVVTLTLY